MGFKAEEAVPALEWDFTAYAGPDAKGVTPEPTNDQIARFMTKFGNTREAAKRALDAQLNREDERVQKLTEEEIEAERTKWADLGWDEALALLEANDEKMKAKSEELVEIILVEIGRLCSDCPSADQVRQLPGRVRAAYIGWLVGQLTNPESLAAGTSSSRGLVPGGVSGI